MQRTTRNILFVSSEAVPFAKTGGLGDVCGALPKILKKLGHDVRLVLPRYWSMSHKAHDLEWEVSPMEVQMGNCILWCGVLKGWIEDVPVYFIEYEKFFGRAGLYDDGYHEFSDNAARFGFFSRACLQLCRSIDFKPDIIHAHDWQTALVAPYLKIWGSDREYFRNTASVFTIHNIGYQGKFPADVYDFLGLGLENFTESKFECHGRIHFMKGAVFYADAITTVSPTHAEEIMTGIGSNGVAQYIERRRKDVFGIINGADYDHWDPDNDPLISQQYSLVHFSGKAFCKETLQREFNLTVDPGIPLIALISRMSYQKGKHLLIPIIEDIVHHMRVQFVILGKGEKHMEDYFGGLPARFPGRIGAWIGYTERKAHVMQAGADFLLMPSLYEPCGLNQIYALRYGTIPIVRDTGGLRDTVIQYNEQDGSGTGFMFHNPTPSAVYNTVGWVVSTYYDRSPHIDAMRKQGMGESFSWVDSALRYEKVYTHALARRKVWA
ncbi:MAG: glycogen synthase GlgA [Candidatus Omnitrophica bacterium]|nr:glycogen synthase GlgA [Candidatus Omnitrophota bacterium]